MRTDSCRCCSTRSNERASGLCGDAECGSAFAATRLKAPPGSLIAWTRHIEDLKRGPLVLAVGRFSDPPIDDDLAGLTLEAGELDALRRCRTGNCDFKLAEAEIASIRAAAKQGADWPSAVQTAFRQVLLDRVRVHREKGLLALPQYADHSRRMSVGEAFSAIVARSPYLTGAFPDVVNALTPRDAVSGEAFYYWSRERYGAGRVVVNVTYVRLVQPPEGPPRPVTLAISTQLFASHYTEGALGITAVVCAIDEEACYLSYLNRTQVDVLGGLFGAIKRALIEQRIESDTPTLLKGIRRRLESGSPDSKSAGS